jgi:hypothetical protein
MKTPFLVLAAVGLLSSGRVLAQAVEELAAAPPPAAQEPRRRAPLADVADLEPAVDVGATEAPIPASRAPAPPRASSASRSGRVMDSLDLGTTSITGNQELPKVLYIVPWKRSDLGDLMGRPVNTLLDEVLAPVDPEVFERHLDYYETLYGTSQEE